MGANIITLLATFHLAHGVEKGPFLFRLHNILFIWVYTLQLLWLLCTYLYYQKLCIITRLSKLVKFMILN